MVLAVGVLGPLTVSMDGRPVELTAGRLRTLLATLAMSAGRTVSVERIATALWDEDPPDNVRRGVQLYLTRLRGALGAQTITTGPGGYLLQAVPEQIDALRFVGLLDSAAQAPDTVTEQALLDEALALWRGTPFDGVRSDWLARSEAPRLVERYLGALERRIDLDLAGGRAGELVAQLQELTARYPLRESLWVRLLLALDGCGRQAEALERYESIRTRLADELGVDPGPALRQVHADLLAGKPAQPGPAAGRAVVPRQLPADIDGFAGRTTALKALHALVDTPDDRTARAVMIAAITGTAGVGKTSLAVHWAHQVADRFPDGQLHVNLRGFHPSGQVMAPAEAIRRFLDALDVPPHRIPPDLDAQAALYRSLMAGMRMLVVLDNARDAEQVRPLLPGTPACLVVVTSRHLLTGLVAAEGAHPVVLDLLPVDEARGLLAGRLGVDRVATEAAAVDEIIARCARLPLALAIAAARAATQPTFPLWTVAAQLREGGSNLDGLATGDPTTDARAVFSWSYQALSPDAVRLFRLLGLHPGPDIANPAAASLAALPAAPARRLLAELTRAHLVTEHLPGRYTSHDLLRSYAAELAQVSDDAHAARRRLFDHYLHTAYAATLLVNPNRDRIDLDVPAAGVTPEELATREEALAWCAGEYVVLLALIDEAAATGFDMHVWRLAWSIEDFLFRRGNWHGRRTTQRTALDAAVRLDHLPAQALAHRGIANACGSLGQHEQARAHLRRALDLFTRLGDVVGQAHTHLALSAVAEGPEQRDETLRRALDLYVAAGNKVGEALTLNTMGWYAAQRADYQEALARCGQALTLFQEVGQRTGEASTWDSLGFTHHRLGDHGEAERCFRAAIVIFQQLDTRYLEAKTWANLGDTHLAAGDRDAARTAWRQALSIFDESSQPEAEGIRDRLANLDRHHLSL